MKRKLLVAAIAICLVAIVACGSLAYFSGTKTVANKFMVAKSGGSNPSKPDDIFSVKVTEPDTTGDPDTTNNPDGGHTYKNVYPGKDITKNPVIENTGAYDQWIRVTVKFTKAKEWLATTAQTGITKANLFDKVVTKGYVDGNWDKGTAIDNVESDNEISYVFYYKNKLTAGNTVSLFSGITIPATLTTEQMYSLKEFDIIVTADAVQADNTEETAKATFESTNPKYF